MDLTRQRVVMAVKQNVRLQHIVAAKHPQVTDVSWRVELEERRQGQGISKGNAQFLWLNCDRGREREGSQMIQVSGLAGRPLFIQ